MFAYIAAGRLVNSEVQQVDVNKFMMLLPAPEAVNHLVVFLTGQTPLEPGMGASVFMCWPGPEQSWHYLGYISNDKPSAIFRVVHSKEPPQAQNPFFGSQLPQAQEGMAQIGISLEPLDQVQQATPAQKAAPPTASELQQFVSYTAENLFHYLGSFGVNIQEAMQRPDESWFPMSALRRWHDQFLHKLKHDPGFWRK